MRGIDPIQYRDGDAGRKGCRYKEYGIRMLNIDRRRINKRGEGGGENNGGKTIVEKKKDKRTCV